MTEQHQLTFTAINGIPLIQTGDDLAEIISLKCLNQGLQILDGDIFVLAQKIVSKSEGRLVDLRTVTTGLKARRIAKKVGKDERLIELILQESHRVLRMRKGLIIVEHKNGFICANAGIDHSNSSGGIDSEHFVLLLPENADDSARRIRSRMEQILNKKIGILIIDSHGRAWRNGTVGTTIGLAGLPGLVDLRGIGDLFGYKLRTTQVAAADELAAGASLLMGQAAESLPCILARGFPYAMRETSINELIRKKEYDLFR